MDGRKLFNVVSTGRKPLVDGLLRLRFHDVVAVVREQHALQPLVQAVASLHVFGVVDHSRVSAACLHCLVFSNKFNIVSALFVHQPLILSQKIDSREGWF